MESLDHNLRMHGPDAAALPTAVRPATPSRPDGGAFADHLARVESPKTAPVRDRGDAADRSRAVEPKVKDDGPVRDVSKDSKSDERRSTKDRTEVVATKQDSTSRRDQDPVSRETETTARDDAASGRDAAVTQEGAPKDQVREDLDEAHVTKEQDLNEVDDAPLATLFEDLVAPEGMASDTERRTAEPIAGVPESIDEAAVGSLMVDGTPVLEATTDIALETDIAFDSSVELDTNLAWTQQVAADADAPFTGTDAGVVSDPHLAVRAVGGQVAEGVSMSEDAPDPMLGSDPIAAVHEGGAGVPIQLQAAVQAAGMATADAQVTPHDEAPVEVKPHIAAPTMDSAQPQQVLAEGASPTLTAFVPITDVESAPLAKSASAVADPQGAAAVAALGTESKDASTQRTQTTAPRTVADPEALTRAEQMLDQLRVKLSPKVRQASLTLRPSELGRLMVNIEVEGGKLTARMIAEKPESLAALQHHVPELKAMLEQRGLEVQHIELSLAQDGSSFDLNAGAGQSNGEGNTGSKPDGRADLGDDVSMKHSLTRAIASEDALDLYA